MSASRLAAWLLLAAVGGAWLASAAGIARYSPPPRPPQRTASDVKLQALASDVQAQAGRLRDRLAEAPAPSARERNPFAFSPRENSPRRAVRPTPPIAEEPAVILPAEPALSLIGIAELDTATGSVRTAMLATAHEELIMARVGQRILGRYEVTAIGPDAVQLTDLQTNGIRRLALR